MEVLTVDVRVGKVLKEYILCTTGGDTLTPDKDSILWGLMKQYLCTYPEEKEANSAEPGKNSAGKSAGCEGNSADDKEEYIKIAFRKYANNVKAYCREANKVMIVNTFYRCYMTHSAQTTIRKFLYKEFKKTFLDYMRGALSNNCDMKVIEGIEEFCHDHQLTLDFITYEMLRKTWYRFTLKHQVLECVCSLNL